MSTYIESKLPLRNITELLRKECLKMIMAKSVSINSVSDFIGLSDCSELISTVWLVLQCSAAQPRFRSWGWRIVACVGSRVYNGGSGHILKWGSNVVSAIAAGRLPQTLLQELEALLEPPCWLKWQRILQKGTQQNGWPSNSWPLLLVSKPKYMKF